jgi:hypothetical protein
MSNRYTRMLAAGGAAVLVAALRVPAALAAVTAKTWTVQPGGAVHATSSGPFTFIDITTGVWIKCQSSTASGTLKSGSGLAGAGIGKITPVTFKGSGPNSECAGAGGPLFTVQAGGLPWHVNFFSYGAPKGVAWGTISHLHIALSGNGCTAVIDGTSGTALDGRVRFRYADSTGQLTPLATGGNLHWYDVSSGCLGLVNSGDPAALGAAYAVTPKQAITSP